jgi:hypothetical protein
MPLLDDLIASNEVFTEKAEAASSELSFISAEKAKEMFPGVSLTESKNIVYFPFKLCHSYPSANGNQKIFMPKVLENSFASLNDQLIDYNHQLEQNGHSQDRIIGHVKSTAFTAPKEILELSSLSDKKTISSAIASIKEPIPVFGLGALFLRSGIVSEKISSIGKSAWKVSMECGHRWKDGCFLYENEVIPVADAELGMKMCVVDGGGIKPYKGKPLYACLGGIDGSVDFWGVAITQNPADPNADILNFIAAKNSELSSKKVFYMPFYEFSGRQLEVANTTVDNKIKELASISVIGETEPSEDGHTHQILSNLTVLPSNGHDHYLYDFSISRGSKPALTGVTGTRTECEYKQSVPYDYVSSGKTHLHLINISLTGKYGSQKNDSELSSLQEKERKQKMDEILKALEQLNEKLSATTQSPEIASLISSIKKQADENSFKKDIENAQKSFLESKLASGEILTKEKADEMVQAAVSEAEENHKKEIELNNIKASRLEKCITANINLDTAFENIKDENGNPITLRNRLEMIPCDDHGNQQFEFDFSAWASNPNFVKKQEQQAAEAASKSGASAKVVVATASAGPVSETASNESQQKKIGKHAVKSV